MSANTIVVTAPGKIILHGEHAVVYGKAAIAATLDLRCKLTLAESTKGLVKLDLPDIAVHCEWPVERIQNDLKHIQTAGSTTEPVPASEKTIEEIKKFLGHNIDNKDAPNLAVIAFVYIYNSLFCGKESYPSISVLMESEIPVGAGLGSSAAFSVSLAASLLEFSGCIHSEKTNDSKSGWGSGDCDIINKWAFIGEKVMHGRPSGIDNSVSTYGGALKFQKGKITHIEKMPTLNAILINTKVPRSTFTLVGVFRSKYDKHREIFDPVLDSVEAITEKSLTILRNLCDNPKKEDYEILEELVDYNQQLLSLMGVSHPSLDKIVATANKSSLKAKLTGAGGGGCAFILVPPDTSECIIESLRKELEDVCCFKMWRNISIGGGGVIRHL